MTFFLISVIAGVLTVLAPCTLPILPVIIGTSAGSRSPRTPYIVVGSLLVSVIIFTFLLKVSTVFITIPPEVWTAISGGILLIFGLILVFPKIWESLPFVAKLAGKSNQVVGTGYQKKSVWGDVIMGAALGPVFSTCSPTYFVIIASVLPASFLLGSLYLLGYVLGLGVVLLAIALLGEKFSERLVKLSDPKGWFKRVFGIIFIILGILIMTGIEKDIETAIIESGFLDVTGIEQGLLDKVNLQNN